MITLIGGLALDQLVYSELSPNQVSGCVRFDLYNEKDQYNEFEISNRLGSICTLRRMKPL